MAHAHCMLYTKGYKHTHPKYVVRTVFPLQQWFHERASVLRYTFIACLVLHACTVAGIAQSV